MASEQVKGTFVRQLILVLQHCGMNETPWVGLEVLPSAHARLHQVKEAVLHRDQD